MLFAAASAHAIPIQLDFASTTYQVQAGDTYADLLAAHLAATPESSTSIDDISNIDSASYASGLNRDYSTLIHTTLSITVSGQYTFEIGTDWGRGGGFLVRDETNDVVLDEFVTDDDIWWNYDWNNPDVLSTSVALTAGDTYSLQWLGFEGCCAGAVTIRFTFDDGGGGPPVTQTLTSTTAAPYVSNPEPGTGILVGLGLAGLAAARDSERRRKRSQRRRSA